MAFVSGLYMARRNQKYCPCECKNHILLRWRNRCNSGNLAGRDMPGSIPFGDGYAESSPVMETQKLRSSSRQRQPRQPALETRLPALFRLWRLPHKIATIAQKPDNILRLALLHISFEITNILLNSNSERWPVLSHWHWLFNVVSRLIASRARGLRSHSSSLNVTCLHSRLPFILSEAKLRPLFQRFRYGLST